MDCLACAWGPASQVQSDCRALTRFVLWFYILQTLRRRFWLPCRELGKLSLTIYISLNCPMMLISKRAVPHWFKVGKRLFLGVPPPSKPRPGAQPTTFMVCQIKALTHDYRLFTLVSSFLIVFCRRVPGSDRGGPTEKLIHGLLVMLIPLSFTYMTACGSRLNLF